VSQLGAQRVHHAGDDICVSPTGVVVVRFLARLLLGPFCAQSQGISLLLQAGDGSFGCSSGGRVFLAQL
jgi:hypothetical protein